MIFQRVSCARLTDIAWQQVKPTFIERFPLIQSAHEGLAVVGKTLNSPDVSAGWRTDLRRWRRRQKIYIHVGLFPEGHRTHISHCHIFKMLIISCCCCYCWNCCCCCCVCHCCCVYRSCCCLHRAWDSTSHGGSAVKHLCISPLSKQVVVWLSSVKYLQHATHSMFELF